MIPSDMQELVREAMTDAWGEICDDTGCHPLDIRREGRKLFFDPRHWADLTALRLSERIERLSARTIPEGDAGQFLSQLDIVVAGTLHCWATADQVPSLEGLRSQARLMERDVRAAIAGIRAGGVMGDG